ncbi:hypothetical protein PsorP6_013912 [Peronosclerospora sorghi]|uniref:Uncharacterized protein n=1 Tax=Peronosclerospora sorghi TaxID=230839 RepID=A0ACC0VGH7_9STRA|nr:hypothetical protein PsorP6_013912 [Peronosclerospora sorghi]
MEPTWTPPFKRTLRLQRPHFPANEEDLVVVEVVAVEVVAAEVVAAEVVTAAVKNARSGFL